MTGQAKLLKVCVGETTKYQGKNVAQLLVNLFRDSRIAGVTVSRGIMGYGLDGKLHGTRVLELSADLPVVIEAVDTAGNIEKVLPEVLKMIPKGLCFTVDVEVHLYGDKREKNKSGAGE